MKWNKVEAGIYETTDRSLRIESHYNAFLRVTRWAVYSQVPAAEFFMPDTRIALAHATTFAAAKRIAAEVVMADQSSF